MFFISLSSDLHAISANANIREIPLEVLMRADAIIELINNKQKCLEYGLSGYNLVQDECNSKSMVKNTLKMYSEIINK